MKRSEMVIILRDRIRQIQGHKKFCMVDSYQVLNTLIENGMLPPENPNISQEAIDDDLSGNYWEPEDDK